MPELSSMSLEPAQFEHAAGMHKHGRHTWLQTWPNLGIGPPEILRSIEGLRIRRKRHVGVSGRQLGLAMFEKITWEKTSENQARQGQETQQILPNSFVCQRAGAQYENDFKLL